MGDDDNAARRPPGRRAAKEHSSYRPLVPATGLPQSRTVEGAAGLDAILREPARAVIGCDFDGTLAPIMADPSAARAHPGAAVALRRLAGRVNAVVIVTARPATTAVEYGGFAGIPGLVVLGHYGWERWQAGTVDSPPAAEGVTKARAALPEVLAAVEAPSGIWIEDKGHALAVHTRRTADPAAALAQLRAPLAELAAECELAAEQGRMVIELRPIGIDKGAALRSFAVERGAGAMLFAGDDLGDLAAYDAVEQLRADGIPGVTVCSASVEAPQLAERADLVVAGPAGVVALLNALADRLENPSDPPRGARPGR